MGMVSAQGGVVLRTVITLKSMRSHEIQKIPHRAVKFMTSEENRNVCESFALNLKLLTKLYEFMKWLHVSIKVSKKLSK